jgi:hypothetical protein
MRRAFLFGVLPIVQGLSRRARSSRNGVIFRRPIDGRFSL